MLKAFTLIEVLVVAVVVAVLAAVSIPLYNYYIRNSKEKVALNYASAICSAAASYYSQSQTTPDFNSLSIKTPVGFSGVIDKDHAVVYPAGSPAGYADGDFEPQSIRWK